MSFSVKTKHDSLRVFYVTYSVRCSTVQYMVCVPLSRVRYLLLKRQHASLDTASRGIRRVWRQYRRGVPHDELNILQQFHLQHFVRTRVRQPAFGTFYQAQFAFIGRRNYLNNENREGKSPEHYLLPYLDTTPFSSGRCFRRDRNKGVCTIWRS